MKASTSESAKITYNVIKARMGDLMYRIASQKFEDPNDGEEKVVRMRYGIGEPTQYSLEEIGQRFNLTRERIRQIELKAIRKLRHTKRSEALSAFVA